jgi:hypothetical protein
MASRLAAGRLDKFSTGTWGTVLGSGSFTAFRMTRFWWAIGPTEVVPLLQSLLLVVFPLLVKPVPFNLDK